MTDDYLRSIAQRAFPPVVDDVATVPTWDEVVGGDLRRRRNRMSSLLYVGVSVVVVASLIVVAVTLASLEESKPPAMDGGPVTTTHAAELLLDIDAPVGEFVITHLRAFITGKTSPGATVTINGEQVEVENSGAFSYQWWLELGRNNVQVVATTPGGETREANLQPHVLPNASTASGYILDTNAEPIARAIAFDDAEFVSPIDPDAKLLPPTLYELSSRPPNPGGLTVINPDTITRALRVDPQVVIRIKDPTSEGTDLVTVSLDEWKDTWSATQPYWVTVHGGVVVQIASAVASS